MLSGTSSFRNWSVVACRLMASLTWKGEAASFVIPGTTPDVDNVIALRENPSPVCRFSRNVWTDTTNKCTLEEQLRAKKGGTVAEIVKRLPHSHQNDRLDFHLVTFCTKVAHMSFDKNHLGQQFVCLEVRKIGFIHRTSTTKAAGESASCLRGNTQGSAPIRMHRNEDGLHFTFGNFGPLWITKSLYACVRVMCVTCVYVCPHVSTCLCVRVHACT